jgi:hypothetical protein
MSDCSPQECFRIISKWESYTVEKPYVDFFIAAPGLPSCSQLTDQEAEQHVAAAVKNHNENESVEEVNCQDCVCVRYESPRSPLPLTRRVEKRRIGWTTSANCIYLVDFTVSIRETVIPVGFCRPDKSHRPIVELPARKTPQARTIPGDIARPR